MENNLGYTTHRKKLLDFIATGLTKNLGNQYTQLTTNYSIQDVENDFLYCTNNGDFELLLDGKEINSKRLSYIVGSSENENTWTFTFPFNNQDIRLIISFKTVDTSLTLSYTIETDNPQLNAAITGREIAIYSHVEDKLLFDDRIAFTWNDIKKAYVADISINDIYTGGSYAVEFDGKKYSNLKALLLDENSYFLGGGESWDEANQKVSLIGGNAEEGYFDIHSAVLLISPDIYRYNELHSLKVWEIREFVYKIDNKFLPSMTGDYIDKVDGVGTGTTKLENVMVSGDGVINHLEVTDSITVPNPNSDYEAANRAYVIDRTPWTFSVDGFTHTMTIETPAFEFMDFRGVSCNFGSVSIFKGDGNDSCGLIYSNGNLQLTNSKEFIVTATPTTESSVTNKAYVDSAKDYILLKAPNGTDVYKVSINESGALTAELYNAGS